MTLSGGMIQGAGKIVGPLNNTGATPPVRLSPGAELDVQGAYTQSAAGVFETELSNSGTGLAQRQLLATGAGALNGTLRVRVTDTFVPVAGDTYTLGTFSSRSGTFSNLDMETLSGFVLVPFYNATSFGVVVQAV